PAVRTLDGRRARAVRPRWDETARQRPLARLGRARPRVAGVARRSRALDATVEPRGSRTFPQLLMLKRIERRVRGLGSRVGRSLLAATEPAPARALGWIRANHLHDGGIRVQSGHPHAYPEVTGYLIPTLLAYGDVELA